MKLTISLKIDPIDIHTCGAVDIFPDLSKREVYIDNNKVPKGLADIILLGFDVAQEQYLDLIEKAMKEDLLYQNGYKK